MKDGPLPTIQMSEQLPELPYYSKASPYWAQPYYL
jgi:hypothetical protein